MESQLLFAIKIVVLLMSQQGNVFLLLGSPSMVHLRNEHEVPKVQFTNENNSTL